MYQHILFPTDGSENAAFALAAVLAFAEAYQSKVTVFHALQIPYPSTTPSLGLDFSDGLQKMVVALTDNATKMLEKTVLTLQDKGIEAESVLTRTEPREALKIFLQDQDVDLIIMGSRGLKTFQRMVLGSMSTYVLNHLHGVPLMVIPLSGV